jgi:hypothetical protein
MLRVVFPTFEDGSNVKDFIVTRTGEFSEVFSDLLLIQKLDENGLEMTDLTDPPFSSIGRGLWVYRKAFEPGRETIIVLSYEEHIEMCIAVHGLIVGAEGLTRADVNLAFKRRQECIRVGYHERRKKRGWRQKFRFFK